MQLLVLGCNVSSELKFFQSKFLRETKKGMFILLVTVSILFFILTPEAYCQEVLETKL